MGRSNISFIKDEEATQEAQQLYDRVMKTRGFIAPSWRAMAHKPEYLKLVLDKFDLVWGETKLDVRSKMLVYLTVSVLNNCPPCMYSFFERLRQMGFTDEEFVELFSVIDAASGMNIFVNGCDFSVEELQETIAEAKRESKK